jgi:hypothetical protein
MKAKAQKVATFVRDLEGFTGSAKLYRVSPPIRFENRKASYIVSSATYAMFSGPETYLFPADKNGAVVSWSELGGSYRGGLSHEYALRNAGYKIAKAGSA